VRAIRSTLKSTPVNTLKVIGAVLFALAGLGLLVTIIVYLTNYPANRAAEYRATTTAIVAAVPTDEVKDRLAFERDLLQYETDNQIKIWTSMIGLFTGVAAVAAGVIAWRNLRATQAKLEVDREAQITNRFTQAIGQLGAELKDATPNLEVRLGGVYALERIARDSPRDHWTIMEVLTSYVRQNAPWQPKVADGPVLGKPRADIQAILTVLGRRKPPLEPPEWREQGALDLTQADLRGTNLRGAILYGAILSRANLFGTNLSGADLSGANLRDAILGGADLRGTNFRGAILYGAILSTTNLTGAILIGANLIRADLSEAILNGANLSGADLTGANFYGADLTGANFYGARNLTVVKTAGDGTQFPRGGCRSSQ
jgi:Pentapeptide repeats (8 copies)